MPLPWISLWAATPSSLSVHIKVCPAHTDKAEINCVGSVDEKTLIEPKGLFIIL